jgi:hypothetical protein
MKTVVATVDNNVALPTEEIIDCAMKYRELK